METVFHTKASQELYHKFNVFIAIFVSSDQNLSLEAFVLWERS